ncbi:50S ribosomal protein L21 [Reticulomyxa filosa]|uniref:Large ribosomal subunit protein bL21m n=1 Tax=Reticulomyxa filosa TaxID=46433 RepID=X6NV20_RETFI|nr:50S ribosomal protein L21 [Reticulomyxa filosa]|eukprot:ETO29738.1 50S ribosomal protein L21 [Reticulomyxa filosa]
MRQYKVMKGDRVMIPLLMNQETGYPFVVNEKVVFDTVLLAASREHTLIGRPLVPGVQVIATVEEITHLLRKRFIWKRKREEKKIVRGSRELVTIFRIDDIICDFAKYVSQRDLELDPSTNSHKSQ